MFGLGCPIGSGGRRGRRGIAPRTSWSCGQTWHGRGCATHRPAERAGERGKSSREPLDLGCKVLGGHHRLTAASYNNVATCLNRQGRHTEALPLLQKALDISRQALGEQPPHTATSYNGVAFCLDSQG